MSNFEVSLFQWHHDIQHSVVMLSVVAPFHFSINILLLIWSNINNTLFSSRLTNGPGSVP